MWVSAAQQWKETPRCPVSLMLFIARAFSLPVNLISAWLFFWTFPFSPTCQIQLPDPEMTPSFLQEKIKLLPEMTPTTQQTPFFILISIWGEILKYFNLDSYKKTSCIKHKVYSIKTTSAHFCVRNVGMLKEKSKHLHCYVLMPNCSIRKGLSDKWYTLWFLLKMKSRFRNNESGIKQSVFLYI